MIGLALAGGALLVAFLATKGKGAQNLTFGFTFKNFGIDSIDFSGITLNCVFEIDNASNQTYTVSDGYFTLRYPNDNFSKAGTAKFSGKTTINPRSTNEVSVKIKIGGVQALSILRDYIRIKKNGGYIMKAGLVGTVSVLDMPSINIKEEINLFEQLDKVPQMLEGFLNIKLFKKKPTTSTGADGAPKQNNTDTPTQTQKFLVAQGKNRIKK